MSKSYRRMFIAILTCFCLCLTLSCESATISAIDLKCEYLVEPINIDRPNPRLSWKLQTSIPKHRGVYQNAYRILVASCIDKLNQNVGDLWDSGLVTSSKSNGIRYQGTELTTRQDCFWKVGIQTGDNQIVYSKPAQWRMALLDKTDWTNAKWIGLAEDTRNQAHTERLFSTSRKPGKMVKSYASPLFRQDFVVSKQVKRAIAYVCGIGYSELYINGQKISDHLLDPGQTTYDFACLYMTHDITAALKKGTNAVGLMVGNGFYGQNIAFASNLSYGKPRAICQLFIEYTNGTTTTIGTDGNWQANTGPVVFDNVYAGETYDAQQEQPGWTSPDFDTTGWQKAEELPWPTQRMRSQLMAPMRATKIIKPVDIIDAGNGKWIVDLGQNIAGFMRISVNENPGTEITILTGEHIMPDRKHVNTESTGHFATGVMQIDKYLCKGDGIESWQPRFTYHGFRYAEIDGLTQKPTVDSVAGVLVHTDLKRTGQFQCSNEMLNKMYDVSIWTIIDNLHSIPEDCPHREKCGWMGDAHCTVEMDSLNFDSAHFFTKYMYDIESVLGRGNRTYKGQKATPGIPCNVAPGKRLCGESRVDWGSAIILVPWAMYEYYGDEYAFERFWPHMKRFVKYVETHEDSHGIIANGYGDWCPPLWQKPKPEWEKFMECHPYTSSTAFYYKTLKIMATFADKKGDSAFAKWCREKAAKVKEAFNRNYLRPVEDQDNTLTYGSQTAMAMALKFDLVPKDKLPQLLKGLVYDINVRHNGHHACGVHGLKHLYAMLIENGYEDLAWQVMTHPEFPSHAYVLSNDMTTWPERQVPFPPKNQPHDNRSYNHPFHSAFAAIFHELVAGIQVDPAAPGYKHFTLKPHWIDKLDWAKASHDSLYGTITSHWKNENNRFVWKVTVPENTTATIYLPTTKPEHVSENSMSINKSQGIEFVKIENNFVVCKLMSGHYEFSIMN